MSINDRLFLSPGDYFFGAFAGNIVTLLGSCVSVTAWHEAAALISVSHMVISEPRAGVATQDTRYGTGVIQRLRSDIVRHGLHPKDFLFGLYGGGALLFPDADPERSVGYRNSAYMRQALRQVLGTVPVDEDVGGIVHRRLTVNGRTGHVKVERMTRAQGGGAG